MIDELPCPLLGGVIFLGDVLVVGDLAGELVAAGVAGLDVDLLYDHGLFTVCGGV